MANVIIHPEWDRFQSELTDECRYYNRREILKQWGFAAGGIATLMASTGCSAQPDLSEFRPIKRPPLLPSDAPPELLENPLAYVEEGLDGLFPAKRNEAFKVPERPLTEEIVASTNGNFYEFLITSGSPRTAWKKTRDFNQRPHQQRWELEITGLCEKPGTYNLDDLARIAPMEERVYRFRCVEAWAMTVPWTGFPFKHLCNKVGVSDKATHVRFETFNRPKEAPGQTEWHWYTWPYYEGLRMDEAMNDLCLLGFGIYGHPFPMIHGAPLRIVCPWKYGYKNPKSLVKIEFTDKQPSTFWNDAQPTEYSFLSNVEPRVPHPRWSQASERLIGSGDRVKTKLYNGYADQVAELYS